MALISYFLQSRIYNCIGNTGNSRYFLLIYEHVILSCQSATVSHFIINKFSIYVLFQSANQFAYYTCSEFRRKQMVIPDLFYRHCTSVYIYESYFLCMNTLLIVYKKIFQIFQVVICSCKGHVLHHVRFAYKHAQINNDSRVCSSSHENHFYFLSYHQHTIHIQFQDITYVDGASESIKIPQIFLAKTCTISSLSQSFFYNLSFMGHIFSSPELFDCLLSIAC